MKEFLREYSAGDRIFGEGDDSEEVFVLQSGAVEILRRGRGETRLVAVVGPGEFFGEIGVISGRPRTASALARSDVKVLALDVDTLESMVRQNQEVALRLITSMSERLADANDQVELLLLSDPMHRMVLCLRQLAASGEPLEDSDSIFIPVTVDELALRLTLTRARVESILASLAVARMVFDAEDVGLGEPGLIVTDLDLLAEYAAFLDIKERRWAA